MKCPLCKKKLEPFEDPASVGDLACPTRVHYYTPVVAKWGVNELDSTHFLHDTNYKETYVDLPPFRLVFCPEKILCCRFKGVVGMQFESICRLSPQKPTLKNINRIIERLKGLMIFT